MQRPLDVVTLGHAIVDVLSPSEDALVESFGLAKGTMTLIDHEDAEKIYSRLGPSTEMSGGSAANTAACLASLGASVEFVGTVRDDTLGTVFCHDIRAAGVRFSRPPRRDGPGTGRCLIMVTPDAEKTMCTSLGIGAHLGSADIDTGVVAGARVLYLEGYLCGLPESDGGVEAAVTAAREAGTLVSLSLSDPLWVELHGDALDSLLDRVDILFANEQEACGITGTTDVHAAVAALGRRCPTVTVTRGPLGSITAAEGEVAEVPAVAVESLRDTTGAGDSYAAGFLDGVVRGADPERCARMGTLAAAEVVSHFGARPLASLSALMEKAGLLS